MMKYQCEEYGWQQRLVAILNRTIYVLSVRNSHLPLLSETLEIIQSLTTIPVQSIMLEGKNLAQATLDFSKKINADLIMISSIKEFCLPGFWNKFTKKLLSYQSNYPCNNS